MANASVGNESEVTLSIGLEDNATPALAALSAGYGAALAQIEAATLAASSNLEAAWQAPLLALSAAGNEALGWLSAVGSELASLAATTAAPTVTVNDLATPTLRAIRAELSSLTGELAAVNAGVYEAQSVLASGIDRQVVRRVIVPELNRLGYRS